MKKNSKWLKMSTAPKDGTEILILHMGYPGKRVTMAQWMDKAIPEDLFERFNHKVKDLPGENPYCQGRWVGVGLEAVAWSNGIEGDERYVATSYCWDSIDNPLGWQPLPPIE